MREEKMISERDAILREREAYELGIVRGRRTSDKPLDGRLLEQMSHSAYPLPKRVVPRVVTDCENTRVKWRWVQGAFEILGAAWMEEEWTKELGTWKPTAERIRIWADLIANPTEEVDDDGSDRDA